MRVDMPVNLIADMQQSVCCAQGLGGSIFCIEMAAAVHQRLAYTQSQAQEKSARGKIFRRAGLRCWLRPSCRT